MAECKLHGKFSCDKCMLVAKQPEKVAVSDYRDAYEGAREDLLNWKRRALAAEAKVREYDQRIVGIGSVAINSISRESHEAAIQAAVAEREAIALMVESHCWIYPELPPTRFVRLVAKAIRARGAAHD